MAIIQGAAADMAETVRCVVDHLGIAREELPMIGTGSVATHSRLYWSALSKGVHAYAPGLTPTLPKVPAVFGLCLALANRIGVDSSEFRATLLAKATG
jgi:hypothetical protein